LPEFLPIIGGEKAVFLREIVCEIVRVWGERERKKSELCTKTEKE
jgi:hypothetical protein